MKDPSQVVIEFNDRINARDLEGLLALMTEDHTFVDTADTVKCGREAMREAWRRFFELFPDYRNRFDHVQAQEDIVAVSGEAVCSHAALQGPHLWRARIQGERVAEWRVYENTPQARQGLGLRAPN